MGDGGVSIPPWSVLGGAFGEAIGKVAGGVFWEATERSDENMHLSLTFLLLGSDVGSLWSQLLEGTSVSQYRMWTRMYSSTCICWVLMWDHYGRKD